MKRIIKHNLIIISIFFISILLLRCDCNSIFNSDGTMWNDFRITISAKTDWHVSIIGLSESGKTKKSITIPKLYDNEYRIDSIGKKGISGHAGSFESNCLEIVYLTTPIKLIGKPFMKCSILKKIICLSKEEYTREYFIDYDGPIVYSYTDLDEIWLDCHYFYPGNIQYLDSLSDELYYLDFYDGGLIEDMPWTPVKDGYAFIGWYKEKECINKWDFDKDEVSKLEHKETGSYREDGSPIKKDYYTVTRIYAKWEKNEEIN